MLNEIEHPTMVIIPLSTYLTNDAYLLRYRVEKREKLVLRDQIRTIDNQRIISDKLAELSLKELLEVDEQVKIVLGLS